MTPDLDADRGAYVPLFMSMIVNGKQETVRANDAPRVIDTPDGRVELRTHMRDNGFGWRVSVMPMETASA